MKLWDAITEPSKSRSALRIVPDNPLWFIRSPPITTTSPDDAGLLLEPEQDVNRTTEVTKNNKRGIIKVLIVSIPFS